MVTLSLRPLASPLRVDEVGVVRIGASRVTLDTLIGSYCDGNIVQQFPTLALADVHAAIAAVPQQIGIGSAITDLTLIATCAEPEELAGQVWYLPL